MDPPTIVKPFKYSPSSHQSMFSVPETDVRCRSSCPQNISGFEDVSFSSYVKAKDPSQKSQENDTNSANDDTEISIFDAHKYFSENSDSKYVKKQEEMTLPHDMLPVPRLSVSSADGYGRNFRTRSFHATPTASSEASWNSQTGLLANPPGSMGVSVRNLNFPFDDSRRRSSSAARKWIFGRRCCCTGKKSVQVKEFASDSDHHGGSEPALIATENNNIGSVKSNYFYTKNAITTPSNLSRRSTSITNHILEIHQHKIMSPENSFQSVGSPRQQRVSASASGMPFGDGAGGFSFPILNSSTQSTNRAMITKPVFNSLEDPPRDSLEVFQPIHGLRSLSRPPSLDNPGNFNRGSPVARDDDICSDASSDLFEIKSFSTQTTSHPMYRQRDSLDEAATFNPRRFASANGLNLNADSSLDEPPTPSVAATECYAPSEVSIDWSVTTAEGFDKASISNFSLSASEFGSMAVLRNQAESPAEGGKKKINVGGGPLLLMSCRHEKAVNVGPQPVKCPPAEGPPIFPLQVGGGRPPRANKPPMGRAGRLSLTFAT